jgi:hypothetical protein
MIRHDNERVQKKSSLVAVIEYGSLKEFRCGRDLKDAAAFGRHSCDKIRPSFLGRKPHLGSINELPVAEAALFSSHGQRPEGHCSLRQDVKPQNMGAPGP